MKKILFITFAITGMIQSVIAQNPIKMDTFSYSLGMLFANTLKQQGIAKISAVDIVEAMEEVFAGQTTKITLDEAGKIYSTKMSEMASSQHADVKAEGEQFLAENKKKPGVTTTASGLQYEVLKMGDGAKPTGSQTVKTHYHGTLINGKVFDSSVDRGEPISFPLNGVIKGWTEALQLMPVGSKFRLFIPYNLAYGEKGAGGDIKPFSALIFEVELLGIE